MELYLHKRKSPHLPYDEIKQAFEAFRFTEPVYEGTGQCKRGERYALIHIRMQKDASRFVWDVPEAKIPVAYMDTVLSTIKNIIDEPKYLAPFSSADFSYQIVDGGYHPVDSDAKSYEIATFMAIAAIIGFDHELLNIYQKNRL